MQLTTIESTDDLTVIALSGRLDTAGVGQVETRFYASIVPRGLNAVVDLSAVDFLASMGIRMLVSAAKSLGAKGCKLVICAANEIVAQVLTDTGIDRLIPQTDDRESALALLRASA